MTNRGQRKKSDFYQTPYCLTRELLQREPIYSPVLEPACGNGAIVEVLKEYHIDDNIQYYDINNGVSFLEEKRNFATIITNPPFSLAHKFIQKAKEVASQKIIMLLPLSYLHGQKRYEDGIFENLKKIYVFTRYPMLSDTIRKDGMLEATGMMAYAWYVWEKGNKNKPTIDWININQYVLKKNKKEI